MSDRDLDAFRLEMSEQLSALRERIDRTGSETRDYALVRSEKARNTAIGVFSFVALILGIVGYLGLDDVVRGRLDELGSDRILQTASAAAETATASAAEAEAASARIDQLVSVYEDRLAGLPARTAHAATASNPITIDATGWRTIPGMQLQVDTEAGQHLILFQASGVQSAAAQNAVLLRLLVDGQPVANSRHEFSTVGWALRDVGFEALVDLDPGTHVIEVQWAGGYKGKLIQMSRYKDTRTLILLSL